MCVCVGHIHVQGHGQGREVIAVTGHAVVATADHGDDIDAVVIVVAVSRNIAVTAAVSHRDEVEVARSTTNTTDMQTNSPEVAANQLMRTAALPEMTNHHQEIRRVLLTRIGAPMNGNEMMTMTLRRAGVLHRLTE